MENIKLEQRDFLLLAELIVKTKLKELSIKPVDAKVIFRLDNPAKELSEFYWHIDAGYIKGNIDGVSNIFPPKLLISDTIEDLKHHPQAVIAGVLRYIEGELTTTQLLENIQFALHNKFDYLSLGQAKSIIKRKLTISLSSAERNDISRLRKKFEGYSKLIDAFEDMVDKRRTESLIIVSDKNHVLDSTFSNVLTEFQLSSLNSKLKFMCWECKTFQEFPESEKPIASPMHHGKAMTITWGSQLSATEMTEGQKELVKAVKLGVDGLDKIDPIEFTSDEQSDLKTLISETSEELYVIQNLPDISVDSIALIREAKSSLSTINVGEESYGQVMGKTRTTLNTIYQLQRTSMLPVYLSERLDKIISNLSDIKFITRTNAGTLVGGHFNPSREKENLKPIPKSLHKTENQNPLSVRFICKNCGKTQSPTWDFIIKQSNDGEYLEDAPIHCESKMEWIIPKN